MKLFNNKVSHKNLFILLCIVFVGSLVRLWGIDFGLPHTNCRPDQYQCVFIVTSPMQNFHPRDFIYPSFYKYILLLVYAFYFIWGIISGRFHSLNDFMAEFAIDPSVFYLIDRVLSAAFGVATVVTVYYIARRLFNEKVAVVSSFFLSLAYLHIKVSHFGGVDVPMIFFLMLSIFLILKCYETKSLKDYFISGICAGLAASTKYPAALLIVTMFITHFLNCRELREKKINYLLDKKIIVFLFVFVLGFLAGTPFALIDWRNFIDTFFFAVKTTAVSSGIYFNPPKQAWWYHFSLTLFFGLGAPLLFASLAGIAVFFKLNWRKALLVFSFPLVYYSVFASGFVPMTRYMAPLVPFFCLAAALFSCVFIEKIFGYFKIKPSPVTIYFAASLLIIPSLINALQFDRLLAKKDNRVVVAEWIAKNIPSGSSICQAIDDKWYGGLQLFPSSEYLAKKYAAVKEENKRSGKGKFTLMAIEYKLGFLKNSKIKNYNEWTYDAGSETFLFVDSKISSLPDYIVTSDKYPGVPRAAVTDKLRKILLHSYHLRKIFIVRPIEENENVLDRFDAFFLPYSGFKGIERPGPNFLLYERND